MEKKEYMREKAMHNPPHPGRILLMEFIEPMNLTINETADYLGVDRKTLSRLIHGHTPVSTEMALRLSLALNTTPDLWLGIQQAYDIWHTSHDRNLDLSEVRPIREIKKAELPA